MSGDNPRKRYPENFVRRRVHISCPDGTVASTVITDVETGDFIPPLNRITFTAQAGEGIAHAEASFHMPRLQATADLAIHFDDIVDRLYFRVKELEARLAQYEKRTNLPD